MVDSNGTTTVTSEIVPDDITVGDVHDYASGSLQFGSDDITADDVAITGIDIVFSENLILPSGGIGRRPRNYLGKHGVRVPFFWHGVMDEPSNISFCLNDIKILFEWKDGLFNVVYDPNKCTEATNVFFECMLPYLNDHIKEKAEELNKTKTMEVTAYCPCELCCGRFADGITASGQPAVGFFVAADHDIPFGTLVSIPGYNNGEPVPVLDRGGAIKGNRIDVFFPTHQEALEWGRQTLEVIIKDWH